ncbi:MAG: zinc ribbon domain-containing protein [Lentisphaeria bacterium]|nr:zinc ribbon domain-containing protein [Lentisphaeria bacterium]
MPIYEYVCQQCRHEFEALVRNSSSQPEEGCPECHSHRLKRKLSTFSASVPSSRGCAQAADCPHASHRCGCSCGCGHHH